MMKTHTPQIWTRITTDSPFVCNRYGIQYVIMNRSVGNPVLMIDGVNRFQAPIEILFEVSGIHQDYLARYNLIDDFEREEWFEQKANGVMTQ